MFLVEHNMNFVMDLCEIVVVLDQVEIMEGHLREARNDLRVVGGLFLLVTKSFYTSKHDLGYVTTSTSSAMFHSTYVADVVDQHHWF